MKHPLVKMIELRDIAIRNKAHPKVIYNLERRIREESRKSIKVLRAGLPYTIESLLKSTPIPPQF